MKPKRNLICWALAGLLLVILAIELFTPRLLHKPALPASASARQKASLAAPSPSPPGGSGMRSLSQRADAKPGVVRYGRPPRAAPTALTNPG